MTNKKNKSVIKNSKQVTERITDLLIKRGVNIVEVDHLDSEDILGTTMTNLITRECAILLKKDLSVYRKAVTLAHEAGHVCLHSDSRIFLSKPFRKEVEASRFSVLLLILLGAPIKLINMAKRDYLSYCYQYGSDKQNPNLIEQFGRIYNLPG